MSDTFRKRKQDRRTNKKVSIYQNMGTIQCIESVSGQAGFLTLILPLFLSCKCCLLFTSSAYIQVHIRLDFFMETHNMSPDHDLGLYFLCVQYRLPKKSRR